MCYNARYLLEKALKRAEFYWQQEDIDFYRDQLKEYDKLYQVSGFAHPKIIIYNNNEPYKPVPAIWGLIPEWIKTEKDAKNIWNKTLNARSESLFQNPSFKQSAIHKRCLIPIDGFYEHHHLNGKAYPFYIFRKDLQPLMLAGIWSEWANRDTGEVLRSCSIITTKANQIMSKIHNNPKLVEPRMPVILPADKEDEWLKPAKLDSDIKQLKQLLLPFPDEELTAHPVKKLSGKDSPGNVPEANKKFDYPELENFWK